MTNNDTLRRLVDALALSTEQLLEIYQGSSIQVTELQISSWLAAKSDEQFAVLEDAQFAPFLNALIAYKRGPSDKPAVAELALTNNIVLQKIRIALNLKAEEMLVTFQAAGVELSKHEISAFFRKPDNKHYRVCKDKTLQDFLLGLRRQRENAL